MSDTASEIGSFRSGGHDFDSVPPPPLQPASSADHIRRRPLASEEWLHEENEAFEEEAPAVSDMCEDWFKDSREPDVFDPDNPLGDDIPNSSYCFMCARTLAKTKNPYLEELKRYTELLTEVNAKDVCIAMARYFRGNVASVVKRTQTPQQFWIHLRDHTANPKVSKGGGVCGSVF